MTLYSEMFKSCPTLENMPLNFDPFVLPTMDKSAMEHMQLITDTDEWIKLFRDTASKMMISAASNGLCLSEAESTAKLCTEYAGRLVLEISSREKKMRKLIQENLKEDEFKDMKITGSNEGQHDIFGTLD